MIRGVREGRKRPAVWEKKKREKADPKISSGGK